MTKAQFISPEQLMQYSEMVVNRFITKRSIPFREKEDVQMYIVEKFILKQQKIESSFLGKSKISTYCFAVLNRMCLEVIRKEIKHWNLSDEDKHPDSIAMGFNSEENAVVNDEIRNLDKVIQLFFEEASKVKLFLALYYRLDINESDINNYDSNYKKDNLLEVFDLNKDINKAELFDAFAYAINSVEQKSIKADAVRMWLNKIIGILIKRLNAGSRAQYDKDSFQVLFEYYYLKESDKQMGLKKVMTLLMVILWILGI